jgi:DUF917 family protein
MSFVITRDELPDLARGAAVLGTGGGGDPRLGRAMVARALAVGPGEVTVLDVDEVPDDAFVVPVAGMGAPTISNEKIPSIDAPVAALRAIERHLGRKADAVVPVEVGGMNSMVPLLVAAQTGLPVIDGDGMGRAFPELQMKTFAAYGVPGSPMSLAGVGGETVIIDTGADNHRMEWLARGVTMRLGGAAQITEFTMTGTQLKDTAVRGSLTLAMRIGRALREARAEHRDPMEALAETIAATDYKHMRVLFRGKVIDVERLTDGGFVRGRATVSAFQGGSQLEIIFQNEHLTATRDGRMLCTVPDLICVLDIESGEAITTESMRYGQRVAVIGISAPPVMRTEAALGAFGPAAFGLADDFVPLEERVPAT